MAAFPCMFTQKLEGKKLGNTYNYKLVDQTEKECDPKNILQFMTGQLLESEDQGLGRQ